MRRLITDSSKCTGCGKCENVCSKAFFKAEDKQKSAIRISSAESGGFDIAVCDQCGVCMGMCSVIALSRDKNGVVRHDKKACVGCLICIGECLRNFFFYNDELPAPFKCSACGLCARECPAGALTLEGGQ